MNCISQIVWVASPTMFGRRLLQRRRKDNRDCPRLPLDGSGRRGAVCHDNVWLQADQLVRKRPYPIDVIALPPKVDPHVPTIGPTQVRKRLSERGSVGLPHGIVFVASHASYGVDQVDIIDEIPAAR